MLMIESDRAVHPGAEILRQFGQGRLTADEAATVEQHISGCDTCCLLLENTPNDSFLGRLQEASGLACLALPDGNEWPDELTDHPRYRVIRLLSQGGMGAVYLAEHRRMGRFVALKVINPELLGHPRAVLRFQQEVKAAAKLDHPNIVAAYDADQAEGSHFLVMEYVEGQTLADYLAQNGPLPVAQACDIVRQAALGLQHAHERGMVHRDIKPHNLMLTPAGQVKVLDFGLARFAAEPAGPLTDADSTPVPHLTGTGAVMGTADYIAPEQARDAHGADHRADIYSLGCTLYHLLTGRPPFEEGSGREKLRRHSADDPRPVNLLRPETPAGLAGIVARMMAKRPADRYQSAAEAATALAPCATEVAPKRSKLRRGLLAVTGLAALVLVLGAAGVVRLPVDREREIVIDTDDPEVEVVAKGDRIVRIVDPKTGKEYRLDHKDLTLSLADDEGGLAVTLDGDRPIVLKRQGKRIATVRLQKAAPAEPGRFQRLFNGKDLTGWVVDGGDAKAWRVEDGELVGMTAHYPDIGWLLSESAYADFVLRFEFQLSEGANSGVTLRAIPGEKNPRNHFFAHHLEVQILDDKAHLRPNQTIDCPTGSLFWTNSDSSYLRPDCLAKLKRAGSWNQMKIESRANSLQVWVNGHRILGADLDKLAHQSNALLALKRYSGRIGFQRQSGKVRFRNIEIEDLRPLDEVTPSFVKPANWQGLSAHWSVKDGVITGATGPDKLQAHTFLCSRRNYRDFELKFQVRVTGQGWAGNSGVQIRSKLIDEARFVAQGPQCDIGQDYWGNLYGERSGGIMRQAPWEVSAKVVKVGEFNDYTIRCAGKHVTIKVNGVTTVDDDFADLPNEGIIAWQLHSEAPMTVTFRKIEFEEIGLETSCVPLFNGKDLTGWQGRPAYWSVRDGAIVGAPANGLSAHTFLCSQGIYKDFELKFKVRRKNGIGNSGVQFRSKIADRTSFTVIGPQVEIDSATFRYPPGSIVTEPVAKPFVKANAAAIAKVWKEAGFNDMTLRCVGERVTVTVNGVVAVDAVFPSMPEEGIIAFQLHGGGFPGLCSPEEVAFKDIQFTDLGQRSADGFLSLFNGKNLTGWKTHPESPGDWRVEEGILVGRGPRQNCLYSSRGDYEDFHFRIEAMINEEGNSGQQFRKAFSPGVYGDGYEAQIDSGNHPAKTGSLFVKDGTAKVLIKEVLAPPHTWFTQEVIARGNHLSILVNGHKVASYIDHHWTWRRGHLALQLFEPETLVRFRKIEIKELRPAWANGQAKSDGPALLVQDPALNSLTPEAKRLQDFWRGYGKNIYFSPSPFPTQWTP